MPVLKKNEISGRRILINHLENLLYKDIDHNARFIGSHKRSGDRSKEERGGIYNVQHLRLSREKETKVNLALNS